jgi:hypothetical protein
MNICEGKKLLRSLTGSLCERTGFQFIACQTLLDSETKEAINCTAFSEDEVRGRVRFRCYAEPLPPLSLPDDSVQNYT